MSIHPLLAKVQNANIKKLLTTVKTDEAGNETEETRELPAFQIGDLVEVHVKIPEGDKSDKTRIQKFEGLVISKRGGVSPSANFTVRKLVAGEGVERIFPLYSPMIADVIVVKRHIVRRAKLFYLRDRVGKAAFRLKEQPMQKASDAKGRARTQVKKRKQKKADQAAAASEAVTEKVKKPRAKKAKPGKE